MSDKKLSKAKAIELIEDEFKKGTPKVAITAINGKKWHIAGRTFERYYKDAEKNYLEAQQTINDLKSKEYAKNELKRNSGLILEREKVLEMSSNVLKIAYNNAVSKKDDKSIYAFASAQQNYCKLQGFDAPTKLATTDTEGNDKKKGFVIVSLNDILK